MNLLDAHHKKDLIVTSIGGCKKSIQRLTSLGIFKNQIIQLIKHSDKWPVIVAIKNLRLAIGHGIAKKIEVEEIKEENNGCSRNTENEIRSNLSKMD